LNPSSTPTPSLFACNNITNDSQQQH
jgi:hypothetical protein